MTTPLIIMALLIVPFIAFKIAGNLRSDFTLATLGGVYGLSAVFFFFTIGHYVATQEMAEMIPAIVPFRIPLIYVTGLLEFGIAIALLMPRYRRMAGMVAIAVFVEFFPSNIYAAINHIGLGGHVWGPQYLLFRAPLQIILIGWAYYFTLRKPTMGAVSHMQTGG